MVHKISYQPLVLLLCSFFCQLFLFSQNAIIDSLEREVYLHKENDTVKVNLLNKLAYKYMDYDVLKAEEKVKAANALAEKLSFTRGYARSFLVEGMIHMSKSELDESLDDALKSLELFKSINNSYGEYSAHNTLGSIYANKGDFEKASFYFEAAYQKAKERGDVKNRCGMLGNIGAISYQKGEIDKAINCFKEAIALGEEAGFSKVTLTMQNNLAAIYGSQGRTLEALVYLKKSLEIYRKENNKAEIASICHNIGGIYGEREEGKKAMPYFEEALELNRELKNNLNVARNLSGMGAIYVQQKEYEKAIAQFNESITIYKAIDNQEGLMMDYNQLGSIYIEQKRPKAALEKFKTCLEISEALGSEIKICYSHISLAEAYYMLKQYDKALAHGLEGQLMANDLDLLNQQKNVTIVLSKTYEATGELEKSLELFKQHKIINDSLFNKENIQKVAELEYEYKYKQALDSASIRELLLTKTVKTTTQNLEKSQLSLLVGIIIFLSITIILGIVIFSLRVRHERSKTENIVVEQRLLRSQMTPHFIFNALSVLQGVILNKEDKKAITYLSKFSKLLRLTLENSREKMVPLNQELAAIEHYVELQNIEIDIPYKYTATLDSDIDEALISIPPMLIQPFVENAIEHGFNKADEDKKIDLILTYSNEKLTCIIRDNGVGIDHIKERQNGEKNSLSTAITSERLALLSKYSSIKGSVCIEDRKKLNERGTMVTLVIPHKMNVLS